MAECSLLSGASRDCAWITGYPETDPADRKLTVNALAWMPMLRRQWLRKTRQEHPGMPRVFRKTLAELSSEIAFFFARLEVKRRQDHAKRDRAAHFAARQSGPREGQPYTGVNRMANRAIRPGVNQLMVRANADRSAPVRAQMPPGPNRQTDPRNSHNRPNDSEKLVGRNESRTKPLIMSILGEHKRIRGSHRKHVSHTF